MVVDAEESGGPSTAAADRRIYKDWQFNLDELPQCINVLEGGLGIESSWLQVQSAVMLDTVRTYPNPGSRVIRVGSRCMT